MTWDAGRSCRRSAPRHVPRVAALACTGLLVSITLSTVPDRPAPPPPSERHSTVGHPGTTTAVVDEAQAAFRLLERGGLPVENATLHARLDEDRDQLRGQGADYRSRVTFEDRRIDRGTAGRAAPGSVHLGGTIEVFHNEDATHARAEHLRTTGSEGRSRAEYTYVNGRTLLRISPYLSENAANGYATAIGAATAAPRS